MSTLFDDLRYDSLELGPDADVIARQVHSYKKKRGLPTPSVVDLASAITNLKIEDTIRGSSTLTIEVKDENWELLDSGFFDANKNGKVDAIDINYPEKSRFWWRIMQVRFGSDQVLNIVCMERAAVHMMAHRGPYKVSRAKMTRAQMLRSMTSRVKAGGGIKFVSKELNKVQPIESETVPKRRTEEKRKEDKDQGIHSDEDLTIKGAKATRAQLRQVERAMDVAVDLKAPPRAVKAMVVAGIGESNFKAVPNSAGSNYHGVFQGAKNVFDIDDTEDMAESFLRGGRGFQAGGAIKLAAANPGMSVGTIATKVEASGKPGSFYDAYDEEAEKLIEAYGGSEGGTSTFRAQYNFQVGSPEDPHENFWDAANRFADEVEWPFFLDGQIAYFDSEMTLIKQKPVAVIHRDDPQVGDFEVEWDTRGIATQITIDLVVEPFQFRAGEVLKLNGFGPASTGSTAKLPGRWLIEEIDTDRGNLYSNFTLKQPSKPKAEPASEVVERAKEDEEEGSGGGGTLLAECEFIDRQNRPYVYGGGHGPISAIGPKEGLDCSSSTSLVLKQAGFYDGKNTMVSGGFASSWGRPGRGKNFTVWANGGHVFIQSEGGGKKWRFDTGGGPPSGPHIRDGHRSTSGFTARHWPGE